MAGVPLVTITNLYKDCKAKLERRKSLYGNKADAVERKGDYLMYMSATGSIVLEHYGTVIWRWVPKKGFDIGGAYSKSDSDAIRTMNILTKKGKDVYIQNGVMYMVGKGPRYKKKTAKPKTNEFGLVKM